MWKRPIINTLIQILGKVLMVGIGLVTTSMLTRQLGVEVYGKYTFVVAVFVFFDSVADFGTKIIGIREVAKEIKSKEVWGGFFWLRLLMTGLATVVATTLMIWWPGFQHLRTEVGLMVVMMWATSVAGSFEIIWQAEMRMEKKVIVEVTYPLLFLLFLSRFYKDVSLIGVLAMYLVARVITLLIGYCWAKRSVKLMVPKINKIKEYWQMSWPMGVYLLVFTTYDRAVDSVMIQSLVGIKELGWYGLAYKIYATLLQPAYFFVSSVFPLLSKADIDRKKLFKEAGLVLGVGSALLVAGGWILAPVMVGVLGGSDFEPSIQILRMLLVAAIFSYFGHLVGFFLISKNGQKRMLRIGLVNLVFNLVMNFVFIGRYGIVGAAGVTIATEILSLGLMISALVRR